MPRGRVRPMSGVPAPTRARARKLERETGIEPATNSLEGCDSTTELLPPSRLAALRSTHRDSGHARRPSQLPLPHPSRRRAKRRVPPNTRATKPGGPALRLAPLAQGTIRLDARWPAMSEGRRAESNGGEGRVRTSVARRRQVYSLLRLTALPPPRKLCLETSGLGSQASVPFTRFLPGPQAFRPGPSLFV